MLESNKEGEDLFISFNNQKCTYRLRYSLCFTTLLGFRLILVLEVLQSFLSRPKYPETDL